MSTGLDDLVEALIQAVRDVPQGRTSVLALGCGHPQDRSPVLSARVRLPQAADVLCECDELSVLCESDELSEEVLVGEVFIHVGE